MNATKRFMNFLEEITDPDYDVNNLEDVSNSSSEFDVKATPDTEIEQDDNGSAVTVVTPKGTSVSVTERLSNSVNNSRIGRILEDATIVFTNKDIEEFNNGVSINDILKRRISSPWNESLNEDITVGGSDFFGGEIDSEDLDNLDIPNQETYDTNTACQCPDELDDSNDIDDLDSDTEDTVDSDDVSNVEANIDVDDLDDNTEDDTVEDTTDDTSSEETDEESSKESDNSDSIGEALATLKKLKNDASLSGKLDDAEKSPLSVQKTNGLKNYKIIK